MKTNRRTFLYSAAAAAGAGVIGCAPPLRAQGDPETESALVTGKPKPLRHRRIASYLSEEQLRWHHDSHYGGALKGFKALDGDPTGKHRPRVAKMNSVILHELYFDNMVPRPKAPGGDVQSTLTARFGSVDRWRSDFEAAAKSARGWAVLAYHPLNKKLYNVVSDSHDDGPPWFGVPLVVIDTYEHSYYIDYQNKKADYVGGFMKHIDWSEIARRLRASGK